MNSELSSVAEFDIREIMGIAFIIGITVVGLAYLLLTMSDIQDDMAECPEGTWTYNATGNRCESVVDSSNITAQVSAEGNATGLGIDAVAKFPEKMKIIVTVVIAAIIIGILIRYLWGYVRGAM